jgi:hypothetical protein
MFVVYVNHPTNKAIIHKEICGKYRSKRRKRTSNGYWQEGFNTFQEAVKFAKGAKKKLVDTCAFCFDESLEELE